MNNNNNSLPKFSQYINLSTEALLSGNITSDGTNKGNSRYKNILWTTDI